MARPELRPPLAGALIATAICAGCGGSEQPSASSASRATAASAPLAVLRRRPTPRDTLPPVVRQALGQPGLVKNLGADLATARQTAPRVWAIAAPGGVVCTAVEFPGFAVVQSCAEPAKLDDTLFVVGRRARPPGTVVAGLVRDGVRRIQIRLAGGDTTVTRVVDNGFRSRPLRRPVSLSFRGPDGIRRQAIGRTPAP